MSLEKEAQEVEKAGVAVTNALNVPIIKYVVGGVVVLALLVAIKILFL